jgi:hypothetical protein
MKELYRKIEKLAASIGKLQKDGRNTYSNYAYISHEQVSTALRSELLNHNLSIVTDMVDFTERDFTSNGKLTIRTTVKMVFTITDLETGKQVQHTFFGAEQDTGGKSMQQAVSQCTKYFLFKLLKITDKGEDNDHQTVEVPPQKRELSTIIAELNNCNTVESINTLFLAIPKAEHPSGIVQACKDRKEYITKVDKWAIPASKEGEVHTVTHSVVSGWACTCPQFAVKGAECKHIKGQKVIS